MTNEHSRSTERPASTANGILMLLLGLLLLVGGPVIVAQDPESAMRIVLGVVAGSIGLLLVCGLYSLQPNEGMAIMLFGAYRGTDRKTGLRWVLPWYSRKKISLRVRNLTSDKLKVNDRRGSPIEIAANVVWRVQDSAQALFDVDDYQAFVNIQVDTALRDIASHYAYDQGDEADVPELTLRADAEDVAGRLREELVGRVKVAGVAIDEARLAHLAYAPEIAGAMLKRQQAEAVLSARRLIVKGAVGMVESALADLNERGVVELDEDRKAAMVSNLLVVLCADREAQPVVNTGTLYG
ncbi:MAG: SPFH domain-containing protein [Alphaproteobacteria bacterium]|jgi:regulator of protease activity HflC (stomatin/prohibitin superfamily)|nr:SPFH domain-containing protein [Alphaproteobacteria bacterium]MBU2126017.1 SPFH domain-containing protein [Alphaproteobacteria bacterium]MBU2209243.1 SPFH domain-containing protein [Alphaproteobacteria bacterium]MBU2290403.1 SPFH domain-containing protein [Alphaproteobacteria bacterium]MBU2396210.1 SPFH domain-containing protein [Alphaproteobacteria bacterium]